MKIFISWSGEQAKVIANQLRDRIGFITSNASVFVSDKDIELGGRSMEVIKTELAASNMGIICLTPHSLQSDWVLFEAGAISNTFDEGAVIPLLYGLSHSQISGPLANFQGVELSEQGYKELLENIAGAVGDTEATQRLEQMYSKFWTEMEEALGNLSGEHEEMPTKSGEEVLEELVQQIRYMRSEQAKMIDQVRSENHSAPSMHASIMTPYVYARAKFRNDKLATNALKNLHYIEQEWKAELEHGRVFNAIEGIFDSSVHSTEQVFPRWKILKSVLTAKGIVGREPNIVATIDAWVESLET